jgi:hypothetical protein
MRIWNGRLPGQSLLQLNTLVRFFGLCDWMAMVISPMSYFMLTEAVSMTHFVD